jgi:hypothetical protein
MALPWEERVVMLSINPEAATVSDIAKLAADLMDAKAQVLELKQILDDVYKSHQASERQQW